MPGTLGNVATLKRDSVPTNANQTNIQPVYEVYASIQGRHPREPIAGDPLNKIDTKLEKQLSPSNSISGRRSDPKHERCFP